MQNKILSVIQLVFLTLIIFSCNQSDDSESQGTLKEEEIEAIEEVGGKVVEEIPSDEKILLRVKMKESSTYELYVNLDMDINASGMAMKMKSDIQMGMDSIGVDEENNISMNIFYDFMTMDMDMGVQKIQFDSRKKDSSDPQAQMMQSLMEPLFQKRFVFKMDERGEILEHPNFEEEFADSPVLAQQGNDLNQTMDKIFIVFPEEEVGVGDTWKGNVTNVANNVTMNGDATYTIKQIHPDKVVLAMKMTLSSPDLEEIEGLAYGSMEVDRKTGLVSKSESVMNIEMTMQGQKIKLKGDVLVETSENRSL
jgi:hypothetical protein